MKRFFKNITDWYFSKKAAPYWFILFLDSFLVLLAAYIALFLTRQYAFTNNALLLSNTWGILINVFIYAVFFKIFHTYHGIIRYSSFHDLANITSSTLSASIVAYGVSKLLRYLGVTAVALPNFYGEFIMFVMVTLGMFIMRVIVKFMFEISRTDTRTTNIFIYGVLEGGVSLAKSLFNQDVNKYTLKGFVSPNGDFVGQRLLGVRVYPENLNLISIMEENDIHAIMVSPLQTDHFRERQELITALTDAGIKIMVMNQSEEWDGKSPLSHERMRDIEIEDLLPRDKIEVDMDAIGQNLRKKRILITGAAGSIGSEMVRQIAKYNPAEMVLIDQAETPMHDVRLYMAEHHPKIKCYTIVGSITNKKFMETIFESHKPDYVLHAAAYKHVPMMEDNPAMAVQNNIAGTRVIADLAVKYRTSKFVMISTDKAVNPTNVMGCSKRICEIYCQSLNQAIVDGKVDGITQFVTTRFGNVLGSNGSVIPIFREQIKNGGPITVTDPEMVRYFMLIPEACKLVLEAGTMGKGGEIYVFDMGKPVKIVNLAKRMIKLSGAKNIDIVFTGLRDGEKLYEEVLASAENTLPTDHPKIMIAKVREYDYEAAVENEERLLKQSYTFDDMEIVRIMKEIVPEFKSNNSKYEVLDSKK
ncbi:MAG: polysaccharide biosynthesis protein [Bacteroidaceae bacterium]|nr:polysaccharide biosynthesis protein [Bacteroidaceae bacterium]